MKNTPLLTLLVAIATVSAVNAGWIDENGVYHSTPLHMTDTIEGATYSTGQTIDNTTDVILATPGAADRELFEGRERRGARYQRRDQRRMGTDSRYNQNYTDKRVHESVYTN